MKKYSMAYLFIFLSIFFILGSASAANKSNTIYFQTYSVKQETIAFKMPQEMKLHHDSFRAASPMSTTTTKVSEELHAINLEKLDAFIGKIRKSACNYVRNGSIKIWITVGGKTQFITVSASANAGMEITILCGTAQTNHS